MSNPKNKRTHTQFVEDCFNRNPHLKDKVVFLSEYTGVDNKIKFKCEHGTHESTAYGFIKKRKFCCHKDYHTKGAGKHVLIPVEDKLKMYQERHPTLDLGEATLQKDSTFIFENVKCTIHTDITFVGKAEKQHCTPCPECVKDARKELCKNKKYIKSITKELDRISKPEKEWLDSLNVEKRQYWINSLGICVDGYCPATNTVYLFHDRFWHGCLETYEPNEIHPILKKPMKVLNEDTRNYEQKIIDAGYNLVTKWG